MTPVAVHVTSSSDQAPAQPHGSSGAMAVATASPPRVTLHANILRQLAEQGPCMVGGFSLSRSTARLVTVDCFGGHILVAHERDRTTITERAPNTELPIAARKETIDRLIGAGILDLDLSAFIGRRALDKNRSQVVVDLRSMDADTVAAIPAQKWKEVIDAAAPPRPVGSADGLAREGVHVLLPFTYHRDQLIADIWSPNVEEIAWASRSGLLG